MSQPKPTEAQQQELLKAVELSFSLVHGSFSYSGGVTKKSKDAFWCNLSTDLNKLGGCFKTGDEWKAYYNGLRLEAKKLASDLVMYDKATGGANPPEKFMTPLLQRVVAISKKGLYTPLSKPVDSATLQLEKQYKGVRLVPYAEVPKTYSQYLVSEKLATVVRSANGVECLKVVKSSTASAAKSLTPPSSAVSATRPSTERSVGSASKSKISTTADAPDRTIKFVDKVTGKTLLLRPINAVPRSTFVDQAAMSKDGSSAQHMTTASVPMGLLQKRLMNIPPIQSSKMPQSQPLEPKLAEDNVVSLLDSSDSEHEVSKNDMDNNPTWQAPVTPTTSNQFKWKTSEKSPVKKGSWISRLDLSPLTEEVNAMKRSAPPATPEAAKKKPKSSKPNTEGRAYSRGNYRRPSVASTVDRLVELEVKKFQYLRNKDEADMAVMRKNQELREREIMIEEEKLRRSKV